MATPLKIQRRASDKLCSRDRPTRYWTASDYEGLTRSLVPKLGAPALMCATFRATEVDPGEIVKDLLEHLQELSGGEDSESWLRGILAGLLLVYGYIRKIRRGRMYRWVLKKFILLTLLIEAVKQLLDQLIELVEWLILQEETLRHLAEVLNCEDENNG